MLLARLFRRRR
ncbi:MAG: hypothetical protein HYX51_06090 [Chloroflexi bacterium]|nr:hypothetical protein [Chloroflexota bacterium]